MLHSATSLTSWAKAIKSAVEAAGIDCAPLFEQADLDESALNDPNARYPLENTTQLWGLAVAATKDPSLGLSVARHTNQTTFHALGFSMLASATLKDCFETLVRYFRIVTDAAELEFGPADNGYKFIIRAREIEPQPAHEASDAMMAVIMRMCRMLAGREFRVQQVVFRRPALADSTIFEKVFKAPLRFAADETAIYFDAESMERPLPAANAELARHNNEILVRYLARLETSNIASRVHTALVEQLPHGEPSQEKIAHSLNMSLRNLQRKLSEEQSSYKEILNQTRKDLAKSYMADSSYSISEIAYLLGFADTSSFTRAFKRWTGKAPSDFRAS